MRRGKAPLPIRMFKRARELAWKLARVGVFFTVVTLGMIALVSKAIADNVREGLLTMGRQMMSYTERDLSRPHRVMSINGAQIEVLVGSTEDGVGAVLDVFERRCAEHSGQLAGQLQEALDNARRAGRTPPPAEEPRVLRRQTSRAGYVACADLGTGRRSFEALARRLPAIVSSGNLSEIGQMRYVYAEVAETGRTRYLTAWTAGEFNVRRMFPLTGDAPGADPANIPRVTGLRRLLTATEEGTNVGMAVYSGGARREVIEADVRRVFSRAGWAPLRNGEPVTVHGQAMFGFERNDTSLAVLVGTGQRGETVLTALVSR